MTDDFASLDNVLSTFGNPPAQSIEPQVTPAAEPTPVKEPEPAPAPVVEPAPAAAPEPEQSPESVFTGSKQNQAFAQMRVQNRQMEATLNKLGQVMGLPENTPAEQRLALIEQRLLELQATATNVPLEAAQKLEAAQRQTQELQANLLRENAALAFQKVKDTYKLDNKGLVAFAQQLQDAGKNPFEGPVDLIQEYRILNFDKIMAEARAEAEKEVLTRQRKTETQSSTPSTAVGKPAEPNTPIGTVEGLNRLLGTMGK